MKAPRARLCIPILVSLVFGLPSVARGQSSRPFGERPGSEVVVKSFLDREVAALLSTLAGLLAAEADPARWADHAAQVLWNFVRELQGGRLTPAQERRVLEHLDEVARLHPEHADVVMKPEYMVRSLTVGKTAPDITGPDLNGVPFRLSDYRGKVVVLLFSSEWCAICRTLQPYERLMQELYKNWPLAILSVETGGSPATTQQMKTDARLDYRSWWDEAPDEDVSGPIASAWNVRGFPTIYVLDSRGVIRFVDVRYEDLLRSVRQLLSEDPKRLASQTGG